MVLGGDGVGTDRGVEMGMACYRDLLSLERQ